ncbi:type VI secretion system membrane subunit TssM [Parashewanella spongiae]|uniref:Type VI secretion system membrane subunit TssM n=1 Tax=Parashewanella spongiae TaxID=342950 RepID=A0A3A6U8R0_9GAMM|nr:type VI secretion system membrane subunit TssM [Parashewanella spongiae]MCL1078167.1 type VI secretion system membrane subunit TssM [Parashewanella spongiae]RJY14896.1 type VI secretion system membrane subunit TssM [Parashewanella spongiae]
MTKMLSVLFLTIIMCGLSALIWWFVPDNSGWSWIRFVGMAMSTFSVLAASYWFYRRLRKQKKQQEELERTILLKQDTQVIQSLFKQANRKLKGYGGNKLDSLYELPWYLVLGGQKDAKSALLQQNGLEPLLKNSSDEISQTHHIKFWSNDKLVAIEIGNRIFDNENIDDELWLIISQQLMKYRPRQGVNGILSLIGCDRLLNGDRKSRSKMSNLIQQAVLSMSSSLKIEIPVYSIFTKADAISDFVEFFEGYTGCDVDNPFGVTFTCDDKERGFDGEQFEQQTQQLLSEIAKQQFELLFNLSHDKSSSILGLPYQLRIFFKLVSELLVEIGRENRVREAVWLRGAYFLSCSQKGTEFDLLTQSVADKAEFNTQAIREQATDRRHYFSPRIFSHVILPESRIVGVNEFRHAGYIFVRSAMLAAIAAMIMSAGVLLKNNWNQDEQWRTNSLAQLRIYNTDIHRLQNEPYSISQLTAVLGELRMVAVEGISPKPWYQRVSVTDDNTAERIYLTYEEQLKVMLLPKIEELISSELFVYSNLENPSKIFEILRFYSMLFDKKRLDVKELHAFILDTLKDQGGVSSHNFNTLSNMLDELFAGDYEGQLTANETLIASAASKLEGLSTERLIYARIKSLPEYRNQVDIRGQLGEKFDSMFAFTENFHGYLIPEILTKQGYSNLDLTPKSKLLRRQLSELKSLKKEGESPSVTELAELSKQIQKLYFTDYIFYWKSLIKNIRIKQFKSTQDLSYALRSAREPVTSPVLDVLGAIVVNTKLAIEEQPDTKSNKRVASQLGLSKASKVLGKADRINRAVGSKLLTIQPSFIVNKAFKSYADYVEGTGKSGSTIPVDGFIQQFDGLNTYFDTALLSSNPTKVMHDYAQAHAEGSQDAITAFGSESAKAPSQVAKWAKSISRQSWKAVINANMSFINKQWDDRVYQFYTQAISGRFPFELRGRGEVTLEDFSQTFKPQGRIDKFVEVMLKPFVYWDNGELQLKEVDGYHLPIKASSLEQLSQTRKLSHLFFGPTGQELGLNISLRPSSMSTDITEFQIRGEKSIFKYNHGPRVWSDINWPSAGVDGFLSTNFYHGDNRVATKAYYGQWAFFRVLFENSSSPTATRLIRKLNYKLNGNGMLFDYTLRNSNQVLDKSLFTTFSLPKEL